ncbi:MAG: sensor histidine kinase [Magnetospiraceae bacterium]
MAARAPMGVDKRRLRVGLALFFLALLIPSAVLVTRSYGELKWEVFHRHRLLAEELAGRIDARLATLIAGEEARTFTDYAFLNVAGDPTANFLQRSPLAQFPVNAAVPGLIGYFQVDTGGGFSTPLLPPEGTEFGGYGIPEAERAARTALAQRIHDILADNRLVAETSSEVEDLAVQPPPLRYSAQRRDQDGAGDGAASSFSLDSLSNLGRLSAPSAEPEAALEESQSVAPTMARAPQRNTPQAKAPIDSAPQAQAAFDKLSASNDEERKLRGVLSDRKDAEKNEADDGFADSAKVTKRQSDYAGSRALSLEKRALEKRGRKEVGALPEPQAPLPAPTEGVAAEALVEPADAAPAVVRITTFESEVDPFEFSRLGSGQFVLFRKVWRADQRYIQGAVIDAQVFLNSLIGDAFRETGLSQTSSLTVAYRGAVTMTLESAGRAYSPQVENPEGSLLYRTRLSAPAGDVELIFQAGNLPTGPGGTVILWTAAALGLILTGGFAVLYRLGMKQIALVQQQQDFVSAVSHELKTPLTSIRMYGEMLREGWVPDEKRRTYYDFIHDEAERLSRLIANVLQLARMTRNDESVALSTHTAAELMDGLRSKISSTADRAGFALTLHLEEDAAGAALAVDPDRFTQVFINLVDNAVKFAAKAQVKKVDLSCRNQGRDRVVFAVRDYGPGVPKDQMRKIFTLFYRGESALTRETVGTGIGLSLVHRLVQAMGGRVDVVNQDPGAEFRVEFPRLKSDTE